MSVRNYILSLMKDERKGPVAAAMKAALAVLSGFYSAGLRIVDLGYRSGVRKVHKAPVPVVSVGNLTLGGTGKTPFTMFVADHFLSSGRKPAILIRGYGGDEDRMLKEELADTPVYVGQDRVKSAAQAVKDGCDVLVLDDGFQHRRLARDLDIVLVDRDTLLGNGKLFPRGTLREKTSSLRRAGVVVVTKADRLTAAEKAFILKRLDGLAPGSVIAEAVHRPAFLTDITGAAHPIDTLRGKKVLLMSGIGDPAYFEVLVEHCGAAVAACLNYGDHHRYAQADIDGMEKEAREKNVDMVLTTKKDLVKLRGLGLSHIEEKIFVFNVKICLTEKEGEVIARLNSVFSGKRD